MPFSESSPQAHFLNNAAHLLAQSAPATSAFLMSRRTELLVENDIPISDAQRQHICSSCGHIMIPGQGGDTLKIETEKAAPRPRRSKKPARARAQQHISPPPPSAPSSLVRGRAGGISKVMACGRCCRKTRIKLEGPNRISRTRGAAMLHSKAADERKSQASAEPVRSSANASSKKRAKNRKAGLQALLDQKQGSATSSGFGLSLSDFMKK